MEDQGKTAEANSYSGSSTIHSEVKNNQAAGSNTEVLPEKRVFDAHLARWFMNALRSEADLR